MFYIKLLTVKDVQKFVSIAIRQEFDIDLSSGRYVVDAKSIMGIFSLDLTDKIKVVADTDNIDVLKAELAEFIVD